MSALWRFPAHLVPWIPIIHTVLAQAPETEAKSRNVSKADHFPEGLIGTETPFNCPLGAPGFRGRENQASWPIGKDMKPNNNAGLVVYINLQEVLRVRAKFTTFFPKVSFGMSRWGNRKAISDDVYRQVQ